MDTVDHSSQTRQEEVCNHVLSGDFVLLYSADGPRPPSPTELTLFCCLVGSSIPFSVDISSSRTVDHLRNLIKLEKFKRLKDTEADELVLFKVSIPSGGGLAEG